MIAQHQRFKDEFEPDGETATIRVVEGWIGNWRISLRRRDTRREEFMAYSRYRDDVGD